MTERKITRCTGCVYYRSLATQKSTTRKIQRSTTATATAAGRLCGGKGGRNEYFREFKR